jgi:hypothetical protein
VPLHANACLEVKINPHVPAMKVHIAKAMELDDDISIKPLPMKTIFLLVEEVLVALRCSV